MEKIIDAHIHTNFDDELLKAAAIKSNVNFSEEGLDDEMKKNNVVYSIAMALESHEDNLDKAFQPLKTKICSLPNVLTMLAVNPYKSTKRTLKNYEDKIKLKEIKGIKIYLGYYPFYPHDDVYIPYYQLADKYNLPIVFHTGECYSEKAKVKYAHPLNVDEIAMRWDNVTFILAHMGEPWLMDTAMVIRKNKNVYADMSGIIEGQIDPEAIKTTLFRIQSALEYCNFERVIYGSDWPLAPMRGYLEAMRSIIPKEHREKILYQNAIDAFKLTPEMLNPQEPTTPPSLPTPAATTPTAITTPAPAVAVAATDKK